MAEFEVRSGLDGCGYDIQKVAQRVGLDIASIVEVAGALKRMGDPVMYSIGVILSAYSVSLKMQKSKLEKQGQVLGEIYQYYVKTENQASGFAIKSSGNNAFDSKGSYGGNQSNPYNEYRNDPLMEKQLSDIVRKYHPDYSDREVCNYLKKLESEGCGYIAMINTLFAVYAGREADFERDFGFPMIKDDGELNYEALVTDFYSATDNHNQKGIFKKHDVVDSREDPSNTRGVGTSRSDREYRYEMYMKDHGIDCDVKNVNVNAKNYSAISKNGDIVVGVHPCILYDKNGTEVVNIDGGHAMTVTGVTSDGMLKVSSWGKEYYIKPDSKEYDRVQFQQIQYR